MEKKNWKKKVEEKSFKIKMYFQAEKNLILQDFLLFIGLTKHSQINMRLLPLSMLKND